jgi:hypothetical protein
VWFTEYAASQVGRIDITRDTIHEYPTPIPKSRPWSIAKGADHKTWFTEARSVNISIGRTTRQGKMTEYAYPTSALGAWAITAGPKDDLWFTITPNAIGSITTYCCPSLARHSHHQLDTKQTHHISIDMYNGSEKAPSTLPYPPPSIRIPLLALLSEGKHRIPKLLRMRTLNILQIFHTNLTPHILTRSYPQTTLQVIRRLIFQFYSHLIISF